MKKPIGRRGGAKLVTLLGLFAAVGVAVAQTCDMRWPAVQFARDNLQRVATEGDLPTALDYADRARREFNHLAELATRCGCTAAAERFTEAAKLIRPAQDADSRRALREVAAATKPALEAGLAQLRECAQR